MHSFSISRRLLCATLAIALGVAAGITSAVTIGGPAAAASSVGGYISRSEILERAQYWVDEGITYTQTGPWANDGTGKTYRRDCSGLVSMAWHLGTSYVTDDFQQISSHPWSLVPGGIDGFLPGDAMVKDGHMELFAKWVNASDHRQGAYVYSFNTNGETVRNPYKESNHGNLGRNSWDDLQTYTPIRYDKIADELPVSPPIEQGSAQAHADVTGDGLADLVVLYDYGNSTSK
ncbi:hypothetical protein ABTX15_32825, partial [Micromonospora sp. NPDC094482]